MDLIFENLRIGTWWIYSPFSGTIQKVPENAIRAKIAKNIPKPKKLTEEDLIQIDKKSRKLVKDIEKHTKNMEKLTEEDLRVIIN